MDEFWPFFLIIFVGVFLSAITRRIHIPWVVTLILGGAFIGPHGFNIVTLDPTISLIGEIGLMFLLFMAGLEIRFSTFKTYRRDITIHSLIHILIPAAVALGIALAFDLPLVEGMLLIIVFVSSSVAIIIPALEAEGLMHARLGKILVGSTIVVDVLSIVALTILLDVATSGFSWLGLLLYPLIVLVVMVLRWILPRFRKILASGTPSSTSEQELQAVFVILLGTAFLFNMMGQHPIIGAFFAGLILAESIKSEVLLSKLHALSYGLFIPVFFVLVGMEANFTGILQLGTATLLIAVIIIGAILSKYFAGLLGGIMDGFSHTESVLLAVAGLPRLSTTLVAVFAAAELGLISSELVAALIATSVVTTILSPALIRYLGHRVHTMAPIRAE